MSSSVIQTNIPLSLFSSHFPDSLFKKETEPDPNPPSPSSVYSENRPPDTPLQLIGESCPSRQSKVRAFAIIASITASTVISTMLSGLVAIATPEIASDLDLGTDSMLWPSSISSLTCGSSLLIAGALSDKFGSGIIFILGSSLQAIFSLGSGLSLSGTQLIAFRALGGVATSLCSSSAVSVIGTAFPPGTRRNLAFASMGAGQTVGIGIGFTLGGVITGTIGWRWGFRIACLLNLFVLLISFFSLPLKRPYNVWRGLLFDIDWVGAALITTSLTMLLFVLSFISNNISRIGQPQSLVPLALAFLILPGYFFWTARQERKARPALIPNSLWRNSVFTAICVNVYIMWAAACAIDQILNFIFQEVRRQSVRTAALQFLPEPISSTAASAITGFFVHRCRADYIIIATTIVSSVTPVLLAVSNYHLPYWSEEFPAMVFNSLNLDALFIISNLVITSTFPREKLGLAGGVFNTVAQIGRTSGITLFGLISSSITASISPENPKDPNTLMKGYKVTSWFCFGLNLLSLLITVCCLHRIGKVGKK